MAKEDVIKHFRTTTPGKVPNPSNIEEGEWYINVADGIAMLKDSDGNIRKYRSLETKTFNVTVNGQVNFPVLSSATSVVYFMINQLDYSEFVSITPAGSGMIVYDDVGGEYSVEVGDYVKVLYF